MQTQSLSAPLAWPLHAKLPATNTWPYVMCLLPFVAGACAPWSRHCLQVTAHRGSPQPTKEGMLVDQNPASLAPLPRGDDSGVCHTVPCGPEGLHPVPHSGTGLLHLYSLSSSLFHFPTGLPRVSFQVTYLHLYPCLWVNFWKNLNQDNFLVFFWTPFPICLKHQSNPS